MKRNGTGANEAFDGVDVWGKTSSDNGTVEITTTDFFSPSMVNLSRFPEDYDYDVEMSQNTFYWDELLPTLTVYCLTFVLGLVGNVLIVFTISRYGKMKSTTNVFLASLASSDLLLILFCIPVKGYHKFTKPELMNVKGKGVIEKSFESKSGSFYGPMKEVLGTVLNEEEDNQQKKLRNLRSSSCKNNASSITESSVLPKSASEKMTLMESSLIDSSSELEFLMEKLSDEIRKCSNLLKKLHTFEKKSERNSLTLSASESDLMMNKELTKKWTFQNRKIATFPVLTFATMDSNTNLKPSPAVEKIKNKDLFSEENKAKKKVTTILPRRPSNDLELKASGKSDSSLKSFPSGVLLTKKKSPDVLTRYPSQESAKTYGENEEIHEPETTKREVKTNSCCHDCQYLRQKILKLERDLERIQKKMPFYPAEFQDSIKASLEKLKVTSETVLQRLRNCTKLRYDDDRKGTKNKKPVFSKRTLSAPEAIIRNEAKRKLGIKSTSNSDYNLNVGMAITMENVDPVTGEKLKPEASCDFEQEGNIQCKIFRDGDRPLLVMDTDFSYNPQTGMLFKKKTAKARTEQSIDIILPVQMPADHMSSGAELHKPPDLQKNFWEPHQCSCHRGHSYASQAPIHENLHRHACDHEKVLAFEGPYASSPLPECVSSDKNAIYLNHSEENDSICKGLGEVQSCAVRISRKKSKEEKKKKENEEKEMCEKWPKRTKSKGMLLGLFKKKDSKSEKSVSRIPRRRKTTPSCTRDRMDGTSPKSSMTSIAKSEGSNADRSCASDKSAAKKAEKARKTSMQKQRSKSKCRTLEKSTQTYEKCPPESFKKKCTADAQTQTMQRTKSVGFQACEETSSEAIQTCLTEAPSNRTLSFGETNEESEKDLFPNGSTVFNAAVQTISDSKMESAKPTSGVNVALQANLPTEESLKYINDLQMQKRVNMAIAELCFHLTKQSNKNDDV